MMNRILLISLASLLLAACAEAPTDDPCEGADQACAAAPADEPEASATTPAADDSASGLESLDFDPWEVIDRP